MIMSIQQFETTADNRFLGDITEVKHRVPHVEVDDSLSEWELARMTSKTWSMEQE
jgi:hypothetical protein